MAAKCDRLMARFGRKGRERGGKAPVRVPDAPKQVI